MKDTSRETVTVDENHRIRSVRLSPWSQRFKTVAARAPLNWRLLVKFALAGALLGALLAWIL